MLNKVDQIRYGAGIWQSHLSHFGSRSSDSCKKIKITLPLSERYFVKRHRLCYLCKSCDFMNIFSYHEFSVKTLSANSCFVIHSRQLRVYLRMV